MKKKHKKREEAQKIKEDQQRKAAIDDLVRQVNDTKAQKKNS